MVTCIGCEREFDAGDLTRHEQDGIHHVHCPKCGHHLGTYNEHRR